MTRAERERIAALRAQVLQARKDWRLHRKMCRRCSELANNRQQYCRAGWDIARRLLVTRQDRDEVIELANPNQGTLF